MGGCIWSRGLALASHDWPPWKWHHLPNFWIVRSATHSLYVGLCKSCCASTRHPQKKNTGEQNGQHQKDQRTALALKILSSCESFKPDPKCSVFVGRDKTMLSFLHLSFRCLSVQLSTYIFPVYTSEKKKNLQLARCSLGKLLKNHLLGCGKFVAFLPVVAILPGPSKSTWGSRETGWDQTDWIWMEVNLDRLRKLWNFSNKKCWCLYGKTPNLMKFVCNKIYLHISMCICSIFASIHYIRYVSGVQTLSTNQEYSCKTSCSQHPSKEVAHVNWWGQ